MFTKVGYPEIEGMYVPTCNPAASWVVLKGEGAWLNLEQLHQLREVVDHLITLESAAKIEGK